MKEVEYYRFIMGGKGGWCPLTKQQYDLYCSMYYLGELNGMYFMINVPNIASFIITPKSITRHHANPKP